MRRDLTAFLCMLIGCQADGAPSQAIVDHQTLSLAARDETKLHRFCYQLTGPSPTSGCTSAAKAAYEHALGTLHQTCNDDWQCRADYRITVVPDIEGGIGQAVATHGHGRVHADIHAGFTELTEYFDNSRARAVDYEASLRRVDETVLHTLKRLAKETERDFEDARRKARDIPAALANRAESFLGAERAELAGNAAGIRDAHDTLALYEWRLERLQERIDEAYESYVEWSSTEVATQELVRSMLRRAGQVALADIAAIRQDASNLLAGEETRTGDMQAHAQALAEELRSAGALLENWLERHRPLLAEHDIDIPELATRRPRGLEEILTYADRRWAWMRDSVGTLMRGLELREQALTLLETDDTGRAGLIAEAHLQAQSTFTRSAEHIAWVAWRDPPNLGSVELLGDRFKATKHIVSMADFCHPDARPSWATEGCVRYGAERERAAAFLAELPTTLAQRAAAMRSRAPHAEDAIRAMEAHIEAQRLDHAVMAHDALTWLLPVAYRRGPPADGRQRSATIEWSSFATSDSCVGPQLRWQGDSFFDVNGVGLQVYTRRIIPYSHGGRKGEHYASFDASLLRIGQNRVDFHVFASNNRPECGHLEHNVHLVIPGNESIKLFKVTARGRDYVGHTHVSLTLDQLDPSLARSLKDLKRATKRLMTSLRARGGDLDVLRRKEVKLRQLIDDIESIIERGFDQTSFASIEEIVSRHIELFPELAAEIRAVLADMAGSIEQLQRELGRVVQTFREYADEVVASINGRPEMTDVDFQATDIEPVELPDVGDIDDASEHDAYDEHASAVIARLEGTLDISGRVANRPEFLRITNIWSETSKAMEAALLARGIVEQAEIGMFLAAQGRVTAFLANYLDKEGWFLDSPVPASLRDILAATMSTDRREVHIRAALMAVSELGNQEAAVIFGIVFTLRELDHLVARQRDWRYLREQIVRRDSLSRDVIRLTRAAASVGWEAAIAASPLGDLIDICEALTGRERCRLNDGRVLSWEERAFSAAGFLVIGSVTTIRRLGTAVDLADAKGFLSRFDDAFNAVKKGKPRQFQRREPNSFDGMTYHGPGGLRVPYNGNGFPEFLAEHLCADDTNPTEVLIEFLCNRKKDRQAARIATGRYFPGRPAATQPPSVDCEWHHSHHFSQRDGNVMIKMQLIKRDVHRWASHTGGLAIGKAILGADKCR